MASGNWIAVIEGLSFAYQRQFSIIAAPPVTSWNTPTATWNYTVTPSTTITSTVTNIVSTTADPSTITMPSSISTKTVTTTPSQVTAWWTSTITRTRTARLFTKTVSTTTVTTSCKTQTPSKDPVCTFSPTKASLLASLPTISGIPRNKQIVRPGSGSNAWSGWNNWGGHKRGLRERDQSPADTGPGQSSVPVSLT
jgi:hypothetical protein